MKFTKVIKRSFSYREKTTVDYIGHGIITKDVQMSTGYRGRGLPYLSDMFQSGTPVVFTLKEYSRYNPNTYENIPYVVLEISNTNNYFHRGKYSTQHKWNNSHLEDIAKKLRIYKEQVG